VTFGQIVRRLFRDIAIALVSLAVFSLIFALSIRTHIVIPFRWIMLAAFAGVLMFVLVKTHRDDWGRPVFWLICAGVLVAHLAVFIPVLRAYPEFRPIWWVPVVVVEGGFFGPICDTVLLRKGRSPHRRANSR
jgi:xanthine/uracil permease